MGGGEIETGDRQEGGLCYQRLGIVGSTRETGEPRQTLTAPFQAEAATGGQGSDRTCLGSHGRAPYSPRPPFTLVMAHHKGLHTCCPGFAKCYYPHLSPPIPMQVDWATFRSDDRKGSVGMGHSSHVGTSRQAAASLSSWGCPWPTPCPRPPATPAPALWPGEGNMDDDGGD